ncbi:hypothetical protein [Geodermatophilus amargosae]|uniref:hypothetical protein n=1 Tax=Geodermatophilus amargosae TaxID=1296565 RepID=UPI0034DFFB99
MFPYDDTAGTVIRLAGDEANRLGATGYDTCQVLLALLRTRDPVTRRVTEADPGITAEAVLDRLGGAGPTREDASTSPVRAVPAAEFREATTRFTAKWRPLVRARRLRPGPRLGTGELWLAVLEPGTGSARLLESLGSDSNAIREVVLATMVPDSQPVPEWPAEVPPGAVQRLVCRLLGRDARA